MQTWFLFIQIPWTNGLIPHTRGFSMVTFPFFENAHIMLNRTAQQGENIWGRGSRDDKGGLIGILCAVFFLARCTTELILMAQNNNSSTIESLLEVKFQPRRTIVLAFGFDEESSGFQVRFSNIQCSIFWAC